MLDCDVEVSRYVVVVVLISLPVDNCCVDNSLVPERSALLSECNNLACAGRNNYVGCCSLHEFAITIEIYLEAACLLDTEVHKLHCYVEVLTGLNLCRSCNLVNCEVVACRSTYEEVIEDSVNHVHYSNLDTYLNHFVLVS